MLEILLVWNLAKGIGKVVEAKGHARWPYQLLLVVLWIGGECLGAVAGAVLQAGDGGDGGFPLMIYLCALVGAAVGAGVAFLIANCLSNLKTDEDFYRQAELDLMRANTADGAWRGSADRRADSDGIQQGRAERPADDRFQE